MQNNTDKVQSEHPLFVLSSLSVYLRDKGYLVSDSLMDSVIKMASENSIEKEDDLEAFMRPLVVKDMNSPHPLTEGSMDMVSIRAGLRSVLFSGRNTVICR